MERRILMIIIINILQYNWYNSPIHLSKAFEKLAFQLKHLNSTLISLQLSFVTILVVLLKFHQSLPLEEVQRNNIS